MPIRSSDRLIRVFISSTFTDMKAERDYLVKFIFPQLRKLCESRAVTWTEVDLRWGVTDEQKADGKVLPIVMAEIERCQPYFIGLLGERYGQVYRDKIPADLAEQFPWLNDHTDKSLTELEILHGVIRNPQMAGHAYFYFRDPRYVEKVSVEHRTDFINEDLPSKEKLRVLKNCIRQSGFPVRENYPDPKALGELVLADFTKVINENWREGSQPDPLDREAMDHEAYAQSRERVYIGRQEYFDRLDAHAAASDTQPLVILGESGSGKSALLANWVARYRQAYPEALVLQHYIGATPYSADWAAMLRRLMGEFKRRLGLQQDIPDQPDALRSAFPNWLYMAAAKGRVVLVLDALNQLEDRDGAPDLAWLPPVLPENVRLIVSTLPGRPLDEIQKRNWPTLKVELLSADERRKLIAEYLAQHAKSLNAARVERIAAAPPSANPLYLRVLLDELRLVRTHEELEQRIGDYLKAESPYALYEKVIARWELDYEGDSDLVGDTLSLLWAARRGLTETELLQALGKDGEPLPRAKWSPLFLAMSDALISRGGLLTFAHDFLRTAVENAYLSTEQNQQRAHLRLADYFERQPASPRRTDELPWQFAAAREFERLHLLLAEISFFKASWSNHKLDVHRYWLEIQQNSEYRMVQAYRQVFENPDQHLDCAWEVAALARDIGNTTEALTLSEQLVSLCRNGMDSQNLSGALDNLAILHELRGNFGSALAFFKEAEQILRKSPPGASLARNLSNQANMLCEMGRTEDALVRLKVAKMILAEQSDESLTVSILGNLGMAFWRQGDLQAAESAMEKCERLCKQSGDFIALEKCLGNRSLLFKAKGDIASAVQCGRTAEALCREIGYLQGLQACLGNLSNLLFEQGKLDEALVLNEEKMRICREINNSASLARALGNHAAILAELGRLGEATKVIKEAISVASTSDASAVLSQLQPIQRVILSRRG